MLKRYFFSAILCLCASHLPAAEISFRGLGGLPGGNFNSVANAVSADGTVVVGVANSGTGSQAFRWTRGDGMVALGDLPGGQSYSVGGSGKSVSADGNVVVGYAGSSNAQAEAFRWTPEGGMVGMGTLAPGGFRSVAWGVSGNGSTVVGYAETETTNNQAFRWTAAEGMVPLTGVAEDSIAHAASSDGSVVVGYKVSERARREAFRWSANDGPIELGFLPGGLGSEATAVTPDGSVIVGTSGSNSGTRPFRWTAAGGMVDIGDLGTPNTYPMAVSDDGSIIVGTAEGSRAFLWTEEGGMGDLQPALIALGLDLTGWHLTQARAVSADGKTIAGIGFSPRSGQEAWIAVIPEPPTWALAGLALAVLALGSFVRRQFSTHASVIAARSVATNR